MDNFAFTLHTNGLLDLGFVGFPFTWRHGDPSHIGVAKRLDRIYATRNWLFFFSCQGLAFPDLHIRSCPYSYICLPHANMGFKPHLKRFEQWWLEENNLFSVVSRFWRENMAEYGIIGNTVNHLVCYLHHWDRNKRPSFKAT